MSVLGIDLGNSKCVVAVARQRGVDVVLNQESSRETPSVVAFSGRQRLVGPAASAAALMSPANSITGLKHLIGRRFSDLPPNLPFAVSEAPDGLPLLRVRYRGEDREFTPTQVLAMLLSNLRVLAERHLGSPVADCCIGVPSFFANSQRAAVLDAAAIAGLRPLRLVHEATAAALEYGIYRTDLPEGEGRTLNVAFVDVGHASMQVSVVAFWRGHLRVLAHASDESLGGRDLDEVLFRRFAKEFCDRTKLDVAGNARAAARLRTACEKAKKVLSSNPEASINVECLMEDHDFRSSIKREELEELGSEVLRRVEVPLRQAVGDAGLCVEDIDVVEVVGSGSRVPAITAIVTNFFGKEPSRTMNAAECVARGCALQCAMLSPTFKVRPFEVLENLPFTIGVQEKLLSSGSTNDLSIDWDPFFLKGDSIPCSKAVSLFGEDSFLIDLVYSDASRQKRVMSTYKIGPCQLLSERKTAAFAIDFSLNNHGIVSLTSAAMVVMPDNSSLTPMDTTHLRSTGVSNQCITADDGWVDVVVDMQTSDTDSSIPGAEISAENHSNACAPTAPAQSDVKIAGREGPNTVPFAELVPDHESHVDNKLIEPETSGKASPTPTDTSHMNSNNVSYQCLLSDDGCAEMDVDMETSDPNDSIPGSEASAENYSNAGAPTALAQSDVRIEEVGGVPDVVSCADPVPDHHDSDVDNKSAEPLITGKVATEVRKINVPFFECIHGATSQEELQKVVLEKLQKEIEEEKAMDLQDKLVEETRQKKNALETYVYEMRKKIREEYGDFIEKKDRDILFEKLQKVEDWLYEDGDEVEKDLYIAKLEELKKLGDPIELRYKEDLQRDHEVKKFLECINRYRYLATSNNPKIYHIPVEVKENVLMACNQWETCLQEKLELQNGLPKYADPVIRSSEIHQAFCQLDSLCRNIITEQNPDSRRKQTSAHGAAPNSQAATTRHLLSSSQRPTQQQAPFANHSERSGHPSRNWSREHLSADRNLQRPESWRG